MRASRSSVISAIAILLSLVAPVWSEPLPPIRVSENGHFFIKADGAPFFWQGDTAWGIFSHATPEEVDLYLADRSDKGFNVIQGVIALWDYRSRANPDGELPFVEGDPGRINEAYFHNVDAILDKIEAKGMYVALLPFWSKNFPPALRGEENQQKMKAYHRYLGQRYAKRNVFWMLGGDASGALEGIVPYSDLMAEGLIEGAKAVGVDDLMISYHPTGNQTSSAWFHDRSWLDFNSIQSGHFIQTRNFVLVASDFAKVPPKPTLDTEPGYENITDRLIRDNPNAPRIMARDVRRSAYLAVFAGAAGHTYGNGEVYEFWSPEKGVTLPGWAAGLPFAESLKLPGSEQIQYVRRLIESRPPLIRMPDQSLIVSANPTTAPATQPEPVARGRGFGRGGRGGPVERATERIAAMRGSDGSYAFIYVQSAQPFKVNLKPLSGKGIRAWWYDPRTGTSMPAAEFAKGETREFTAPSDVLNPDWVLVLDDNSKRYRAPGGMKGAVR